MQALHRLDRRKRQRRTLAVTIAAIVLLAGIPLGSRFLEHRRQPVPAVATATKISVPLHETLSDGSEVEMKDGAEIKVDFTHALRRVVLRRGEAHFTVTKDLARPFIVEADGIEFRAVGTAFTVHSGAQSTELIVTHGIVAVEQSKERTPDSSTSEREQTSGTTTLSVGERVVIDKKTAAMKVDQIAREELAERLAWRATRIEFSGATLSEVVSVLNKQMGYRHQRRFVIDDPSIAQLRVSGLFRGDNLEAFVDVLEEGFGISAESRTGGEIVLRGKSR